MSALKDDKTFYPNPLSESKDLISNLITKDPTGIVGEYSAVYFDFRHFSS